ncbi:hypothetical protein J3459_014975 [Metarhizium acridum]|nr:hypothetical protein J3459_014975 [Metarhizium acridum]
MTCICDESGARDGVPRHRLAAGTTSGLLDRPWQRFPMVNGSGTGTCVVCSWLDMMGFAYFPTSSDWCQGVTEAVRMSSCPDTPSRAVQVSTQITDHSRRGPTRLLPEVVVLGKKKLAHIPGSGGSWAVWRLAIR